MFLIMALVKELSQGPEGKQPEIKVGAYDPAVEKFSNKPETTFDLVTSFDVLEHIERSSVQVSTKYTH